MAQHSCLAPIVGLAAAAGVMAAQAQPQVPQPAAAAAAAYVPPIVLTHQEPHHRQVFQYGPMRILDLRVPPNDVTWYHTHEWPVLYVTFSGSQVRTDTIGQENEPRARRRHGRQVHRPREADPGSPQYVLRARRAISTSPPRIG